MNRQRLTLLWLLALLVAVANTLVVVWRLPVQRRLADDADERAVQDTARWIAPLPTNARLLLLVSHTDPTNFHYSTRLLYFLYPHRLDIASDALPPTADTQYDYILAFGGARAIIATQTELWKPIQRNDRAVLTVRATSIKNVSEPGNIAPRAPLLPPALRAISGLFGLAAVPFLGALLMGVTLRRPPFPMWWANLACAHLIGATAMSLLFNGCILLVGKPLVWPVYALAALLLPAGRRAWTRIVDSSEISAETQEKWNAIAPAVYIMPADADPGAVKPVSTRRLQKLCCAALVLGMLTIVERGWLIGWDWDALAIWQLKAKLLFLDGDLSAWRDTAQFPYAHFDYPLLVPLQSWWAYRHFGAIHAFWGELNGFLFYLDLLAIFAAGALRYIPRLCVWPAVALLCGLPEVTLHAVSGYADLTAAVYFLGIGVFLTRVLAEREIELWPLVGWMLAGILLVKNEGLLACTAALLTGGACLLHAWRNKAVASASDSFSASPDDFNDLSERKRLLRLLLAWLACAALAYLPWWLFKQRWHLTNDVMQAAHPPHLTARLLWWRLWYAMSEGFGNQMLWVGPRFPAWGLLGLLLLTGLIAARKRRVFLSCPLWLLSGIQLCGYIGIYLITPSALPAHVVSSVDRLVLHIAPTLLLAALAGCFMKTEAAEKAAGASPTAEKTSEHALDTTAQTE